MLTKGAIGNLVNRYKAVLKKCNLINTFGSLAVASMLVLGGAAVAEAAVKSVTTGGTTGLTYPTDTDTEFDRVSIANDNKYSIINDSSVTIIGPADYNDQPLEVLSNTANRQDGERTQLDITTKKFTVTHSYKGQASIYADTKSWDCSDNDNSVLNVTADSIEVNAPEDGYAVYVRRKAVVNFDAKDIVINGENCLHALDVQSQSVLNMKGNVTINAQNSSAAILTRGGSTINIGQNNETVKIAGDIVFYWNHNSPSEAADSFVNITLSGEESSWEGNCRLDWKEEKWPTTDENLVVSNMKLNIEDGATWTPTASTDVVDVASDREDVGSKKIAISSISLDGGNINIPAGVDTIVKDVTGSGNINMENADDLGSFSSDDAGNATLQVRAMGKDGKIQNADSVSPEQLEKMWNAVDAEGATVTALAEEGLVEGKITVSDAGDTVQAEKTPEPEVKPEEPKPEAPEPEVKPEEPKPEAPEQEVKPEEPKPEAPEQPAPEVSPEQPKPQVQQARNTLMDSALQIASVNTVALDKILTNDVRKRLGDIRSDKNTTGVWMRWDGGKLKGDAGVTNDFNTVQIGGDTKVGKNCRVGVAGSFTHGDSEFARGIAELEGFSFAAYATWMGENGMFADVVARLGHFSNEMKVEGRTGDIDSRVASLSGEYGWRFDLCEQFFIEPQVELAYTYVSSDDLQLGTAKYSFDSVNSLTGRAGAVFGWKLPNERGNLYARASVVQQFLGDAKISGVNGEAFNVQELDGNDTWLEYGIGANVKLTDKTYLWADIERTEGSSIEEEWRGTVGVRFSF